MTEMSQAEEVFFAALEKAPADRPAYLDAACAGKPELRARVEKLLAAHPKVGGFLEPPVPDATSDLPAGPPGEPTGTFGGPDPTAAHDPAPGEGTVVAGRYTLVEPVGEGGMGSVWRARHTDPVKRFVAVKLIKAGMDSKVVLARFEAERQALALMDHPNIAKVLDGGVHAGRPYFVMELVKGVPITAFCDARKLTPRERLELFIPVCQAVQHAHQKGVIHRDLKPSNVLVALYDDKPVPKVIDFGVAKAAGAALTEQTIDTGFGGVVGTPQYMSPEQATFNNLDVDTRSDVYSLGVLLYELLAGSPPFARKELERKGLLEILRVVREEEPPRPSTKLSTADALPTLSANRGTEPRKLTGLLRSELDWVVMKALEKDRARRYDTANAFAADVQRYLAGEAVQAHPPSRGYRLRKFVRRNKGRVVAAGLVFFALLAGMAGTTWGLIEARRQERLARAEASEKEEARRAETERAEGEAKERVRAAAGERLADERLKQVVAEKKKTEEEKATALAVKSFLQDKLLLQADITEQAKALTRAGGRPGDTRINPTVRELLDRAAEELAEARIEANFPNQPLLRAELLHTVGVTYRALGEAGRAVAFLQRARALRLQHLGVDHRATLASTAELASAFHSAGKFDQVLPLVEETLARRKAALGADHPDTLASMHSRVLRHIFDRQLDAALALGKETLARRKAVLGADHPDTFVSMTTVAGVHLAAGKYGLAISAWQEVLDLQRAKLGADHPDTLSTMSSLAAVYQLAGKNSLALPICEESLRLVKAKWGPDHPYTRNCTVNLAACYRNAGRIDAAVRLLEETLAFQRAVLGADHPDRLACTNNLAGCYLDLGKFDLAVPLLEDALRISRSIHGVDDVKPLEIMFFLAQAYELDKKFDLALPLREELVKRRKAMAGDGHEVDTLRDMSNLVVCYKAVGKVRSALPVLEEMLAIRKAKLGAEHADTLLTLAVLGNYYCLDGQGPKAVPLFKEVLAVRRKLVKSEVQLAIAITQYAMILLDAKEFAAAEELLRECLALREKAQPEFWTTSNTRSLLGAALSGQRKYAEAEPFLVQGYEGMKQREKTIQKVPETATRLPDAADRLVELYVALGKPDEVRRWRAERAAYPFVAPPPRPANLP